ncbi:MAG: hypothetical protein A2X05_01935 [Bacteroidetes bacterium GWE2_41_25]|nr:MAG: hypothetical protein A2X03_14175 [Bacteroidetes bacterium GWA2_40_15]OFX90989.1 MAG: hypothetical protein A2X06_04130 [Bacteroidetes bacterium GWC2_40_22]OFY11397.1 MAG: hypothetical protein A2X05_01935 [Bacteroidetes bacterium GWE2_41_25]OFY61798.1 MAG: hypothetical protein A2X04_00025 [Bacteroidetes bacterium GWF2_41_9]HAM09318.1 hypothetical protein [Bacteroidales bacterium]
MFLKLLILSLIFIAIAALGLGIRMLIRSGGRFLYTHISHNKEMMKRGITCAQQNDVGCNSTEGYPGCACSNKRLAD